MKYFKDKQNQIYAYDDDVSDEFLNAKIKELSLTPLSEKELNELTSQKEPPLTLEALQITFKARVDEIMNKEARARGYDDIVSAVSYAGYENAFQKEALAFGKWRSNVWSWGYSLLNQIQNSEININELNIDEVFKDMPRLELE